MTKEKTTRKAHGRTLANHLPETVAEYPFEVSLSIWGVFIGAATLIPGVPTPSVTLRHLPAIPETLWGIGMLLGAVTMTFGLRRPAVRLALLARGLALCAVTMLAFGIMIFATQGWSRMTTTVLLVVISGATGIRAAKLRADYYSALTELTAQYRNGHGDHSPEEK
jgi:CHASE2 domain-containing sensor protein